MLSTAFYPLFQLATGLVVQHLEIGFREFEKIRCCWNFSTSLASVF